VCRVLAYLGEPVLLDDLLYKPDSSLVTQSYSPRMLQMLNLGGFGLLAWDPASHAPGEPFAYRSTHLPMFDSNLKGLAGKIRARAAIAHVRGVPYHAQVSISEQNLHPFRFEGARWAMAHNGDLFRFPEIKFALLEHIDPLIARRIKGNTDSEWMYALFLTALRDPVAGPDAAARAVIDMLRVVRGAREKAGIDVSSPVNLFLSDGVSMLCARFTFDYGCFQTEDPSRVHEMQLRYLSCWYTAGSDYGFYDGEWKMRGGFAGASSVMVASEPLTRDVSTWLEVPEYGLIYVDGRGERPSIGSLEIDA
jgi:glutamine amidotransferase